MEVVWAPSIRRKIEGLELPGKIAAHLVDHATRKILESQHGCSDVITMQFTGPAEEGRQVLCFASIAYTFCEGKAAVVGVEATVIEPDCEGWEE